MLFSQFSEELPSWFDSSGGAIGCDVEEFESICQFSSTVEGWLSEAQGIALYQLARRSISGEVLEIGSFCGKSTLFLVLGYKQSGTVVRAVDPHKAISEGGKEQYAPDFSPCLENFRQHILHKSIP